MVDSIAALSERLEAAGVPFAVIGAAAMSARGFPRQTLDFDLLVTDRRVLEGRFWEGVGTAAEIRVGDGDDPLAGVVRFARPAVDVIVGRFRWQGEALARATRLQVGGRALPVATLGDLILLKLHAGASATRPTCG
ncbi:MAG TPA: nucleotidyltransferase [Thermoanaerobaculia bacterium]|nr:nucleotidyltransferase [Thermoanaerobaculia bacterium]